MSLRGHPRRHQQSGCECTNTFTGIEGNRVDCVGWSGCASLNAGHCAGPHVCTGGNVCGSVRVCQDERTRVRTGKNGILWGTGWCECV